MTTGLQLSRDTTPRSRRRQGVLGEVADALTHPPERDLEVVVGCGERQPQVPRPARPKGGAGKDRHTVHLQETSCDLLRRKPRALLELSDVGKRVEGTLGRTAVDAGKGV